MARVVLSTWRKSSFSGGDANLRRPPPGFFESRTPAPNATSTQHCLRPPTGGSVAFARRG